MNHARVALTVKKAQMNTAHTTISIIGCPALVQKLIDSDRVELPRLRIFLTVWAAHYRFVDARNIKIRSAFVILWFLIAMFSYEARSTPC